MHEQGGPLIWILGLVACWNPAPEATPDLREVVDVVRVVDGDTLDVRRNGATERIRLKGVNTPEKGECGAQAATEALVELAGDQVAIERDGKGTHGRTLGYLWAQNGAFVQRELVVRGLALAYPYGSPDAYSEGLAQAQSEAESARRGMFNPSACGPPLVDPGMLRIAELDYNPPGSDLEFGGGESVVILGPPGFDLSGWTLKDTSASHRLHFPAHTTLDNEGRLRVYTPCGESRPGALFWCVQGSGVWNNDGDTAFLLDPRGNIVASRDTE